MSTLATPDAMQRIAQDAGVSVPVMEQALEWLVTSWSGDAHSDDRQNLEAWRSARPDHEQAWQRVQLLQRKLSVVPPAIATASLRRRGMSRRQALHALSVMLACGASAYALRESRVVQARTADLRTGTGEIHTTVLDDGTTLTLNTATSVNLHYTDTERRLELVEGELLVATAPDTQTPPRPFILETAHGHVTPVGTRFVVRQTDDDSEVSVLEGAVRVQPLHSRDTPLRLEAGESTRFSRVATVGPRAAHHSDSAWTRHQLVVERVRLGDFLQQLARYRPGIIRCAPNAAELIVSGTYPLPDTDRILSALAQALPIQISMRSRWWVTVEGAESIIELPA